VRVELLEGGRARVFVLFLCVWGVCDSKQQGPLVQCGSGLRAGKCDSGAMGGQADEGNGS